MADEVSHTIEVTHNARSSRIEQMMSLGPVVQGLKFNTSVLVCVFLHVRSLPLTLVNPEAISDEIF
jgi:hypothetical protein